MPARKLELGEAKGRVEIDSAGERVDEGAVGDGALARADDGAPAPTEG